MDKKKPRGKPFEKGQKPAQIGVLPLNHEVKTSLDDQQLAKLDRHAALLGLKRSAMLRSLVEALLENPESG